MRLGGKIDLSIFTVESIAGRTERCHREECT
jgi:hypothetical protein